MSRKRGALAPTAAWENKMKTDQEAKATIKYSPRRVLKRNQSDSAVAVAANNKTRPKLHCDKNTIRLRKTRSESDSLRTSQEIPKLEDCQDKNLTNATQSTPPAQLDKSELVIKQQDHEQLVVVNDEKQQQQQEVVVEDEGEREYEYEDEVEMEMEMENECFDIKEMNACEEMQTKLGGDDDDDDNVGDDFDEEKQLHQIDDIPISPPPNPDKNPTPPPHFDFTKPSPPVSSAASGSTHETPNNMQNLVDLVMWRDVSKSALIFGVGTFVLVSSSFTRDVNFSLISAVSYLGLVHLAAIFFYKSIICRIDWGRGRVDCADFDEKHMIVGEEEVIWLLKRILPYLNEILLKMRCLFSGDPATTMKLAVLLFVLARCGSSITTWTLARLAFFGVFTVPKFCAAYSNQLASYGNFWLRRFRDAWDSCTHKKAVAIAIFTVIWNLSSVVARIWAGFVLLVAVRFYQQSAGTNCECGQDQVQEEVKGEGEVIRSGVGVAKNLRYGSSKTQVTKAKKGY